MGDFTIIRGDNYPIKIVKYDEDDTKIAFVAGDEVTFSAKKNLKQTAYDIQKSSTIIADGEITLTLDKTATDIPVGDYFYDIEYVNDLDEPVTISKGILTIDWDITRPTV